MSNPNECDKDVFTKGASLGLYDMSKEEAESYCKRLTETTGRKHDWHYAGGRVHVLAMRTAEAKEGGK